MIKKFIIATVVVFVAWQILDYLIHGVFLMSAYGASQELWRPMEEMKMGMMFAVTFVVAACFCWIYTTFINPKSMLVGIRYGALYGLAGGISMGFGSYSYMPILPKIALTWFVGTIIEFLVAGIIVGALIKEETKG